MNFRLAWLIPAVGFVAMLWLNGCVSQITPPSQPTPISIQAANAQLAALTSDPATTWRVGDMSVRAACQVYLNQEAAQAAQLGQVGVGAGALGAGLSALNPLAGVASSLLQTFLTAYQAAGVMPYMPETSMIVMSSLDAYEAGVSLPTDQATAMSYVDDEWFLCSPGGYMRTVSAAIGSAMIGTQSTSGVAGAAFVAGPRSTRPIVTVNGR
jgi:hypothetical protein